MAEEKEKSSVNDFSITGEDTEQSPVTDFSITNEARAPSRLDIGQPEEQGFFSRAFDAFRDFRLTAPERKFTRDEAREVTKENIALNRRMFGGRSGSQFSFGEGRAPSHSALVRAGLEEPPTEPAEKAMSNYLRTDPDTTSNAVRKPIDQETDQPDKEDPWGLVLWDSITNVPAMWKRQYGGAKMFLNAPRDLSYILEAAADEGVAPENSFALEVEAYVQGKDPAEYYQELLKQTAENVDLQEGQRMFQEATDYLQNYQPNVREDSAKFYAGAIVEGAANMAPALIVTAATRSPSVGAALMGGQVFADQYAESINRGRSHSEAVIDGTVFAAAETLTERIPLGILTKEGGTLLQRVLKAGAAEGIQEPLTQLIQEGYERAIINDEMTLGEALIEITTTPEGRAMLRRSAIIGFGVGGTLASITHPFYQNVTEADLEPPANRERPPRKPRLPSEQDQEITDAEAQQLGLRKTEVTQDLLERVAAGDPLTVDEQYTLTNDGYGRFVGAEERVMLLPKGRRQLMQLREQADTQAAERDAASAQRLAEFEDATVVPDAQVVRAEGVISREAAVGEFSQFLAAPETHQIPNQAFEVLGRDQAKWEALPMQDRITAATTIQQTERDGRPRLVAQEPAVSERETFRSDKPESRRAISERLAAAEARVEPEPTEGQKKSGNYKKGHIRVDGMDIAIENAKGGTRSGVGKDGKPWSVKMKDAYGYIKGTQSRERDGYGGFDQVDAFIGRYPESGLAVVINQKQDAAEPIGPANFDEHKVMLGYRTAEDALKAYRRNYSDGGKHLGDYVEMTTAELREWLNTGRTKEMVTEEMVAPKTAPRPGPPKTNEGKGVPRAKVQGVLRPLYRGFRTVPPVRVVESIEDLPTHLQVALDSPEAKQNTTGIYDQGGILDSIYIISNNVTNEREAIETMLHEVVGHFGLRNVMDDYLFNEVMDDVADSFDKEVRDIANTYELDFTDIDERRIAAEEFIAHTAQRLLAGPSVGDKAIRPLTKKAKALLKRVVEAIRNTLRRLIGDQAKMTTGQIHSIIAQASDYVARPGGYRRDKRRGARRHTANPTYYSQMFRVVNEDQAKARAPADWKNWLNAQVKKGRIKAEELKWSGLEDFLDDVTWKDVLGLSSVGIPREIQEAVNRRDEALQKAEESLEQIPFPENIPESAQESQAKLDELLKGKPKKLSKEALLKQIQLEGTHIEVIPPGAEDSAPIFDKDDPHDEDYQKPEDEIVDDYLEWKADQNYEDYLDESLLEVYEENNYDPELTDEQNEQRGWDRTSEDHMRNDAMDRADQNFDEQNFEEFRKRWIKENVRLTWYISENYMVTTDSDGDYVAIYDPNNAYHEIGFTSDPEEVNRIIQEHFEESSEGVTRWSEYTLPGGKNYQELLFRWKNADPYTFEMDSHWGSNDNMVAHARFDERADMEGNKLIFIDEIQSDWRQQIRDQGVADPVEQKRLSNKMQSYWRTYLNEQVPEMLTEMRQWDIDADIASTFKIPFSQYEPTAIASLSAFHQRREKFDEAIDIALEVRSRMTLGVDIFRLSEQAQIVADRHGWDPNKTGEQNRLGEWDGTSLEDMRAEAVQLMRADKEFMSFIEEQVVQDGTPRPVDWSKYLDILQRRTIEQDQLSQGLGSSQMQLGKLYVSMAPVINDDPKLKAKRAALAGRDPDPLPVQSGLIALAKTTMLNYAETREKYYRILKGIAPAPFEKTWQLLVMKHMIRESVNRGYKKLAIAPGEVHGFRWSGANRADFIDWTKLENGNIYITPHLGALKETAIQTTRQKLQSVVGADVAQLINNSDEMAGTVKPEEVGRSFIAVPSIGSETLSGGREIYNVITPNIVNKFLKKYKTRMQIGRIKSQFDLEGEGVKMIEGFVEDSQFSDHGVRSLTNEEKNRLVHEDSRDETWYSMHDADGRIIEGQVSMDRNVPQRRLDELRANEARLTQSFEAWTIDITPELAMAARDSFPLFHRRKNRTGDPGLDKALEWANKNIGPQGPRTVEQIQDRVNEILRVENKQAKIEQALVDQFAGLKWAIRQTHGHDLPAEVSGYKQAHFTTSQDSQMFVFLTHGIPYWEKVRDGTITQIKAGTKGLLEVLEPVADNIREWGYWMAARRANRLLKEGREALFTQERVDELLKLGDRFPEFQDVADDYNDWKTQFLDWAEGAGVINSDTRPLWDQADYVPFYRIKADELGGSFMKRAGMGGPGIANVAQPIKRLLGSKHPLGDILENIIVNFQHIAASAMKNKAAQLAVENLKDTGLITPAKGSDFLKKEFIPMDELKRKLKASGVDWQAMPDDALESMQQMWTLQRPQGDQFISVMYNGKKKWFEVHEETLLRSLTAINERKFSSLMGRLGMWLPRKFKRLGTTMITLAPGFMAANWFRDVFMSFTNSRHARMPRPWAGATGAWKAFTKSPEMVSMMAAGGAFYSGYINANDPAATAKAIKRSLRQTGFKNRIVDAPWKLFHVYNDIAAASENANRIGSGYIPAIKAGAGKAEAVWESKDLMNFAKHGDHALMQFFAQSVMFLNARIQGMVRYGQRFAEAPGITFAKSMLYAMAVLAMWLKNKDDERYKALPEEEKDMYVHFWINGNHWRLPKAFEVGMVFGVGVERMFEYFYSNEDDAGKVAIDRMWFVFGEVFNFFNRETIVPLPQFIQPLYEATNNWNAFFQAPIVPEYMMDVAEVKPEIVYRPRTSPTMRALAEGVPDFAPNTVRNPMLLEHLFRGYFGTLGSYVMMASDDLVRSQMDMPPRPALRWQQVPFVGRFYRGDEPPSRSNYEEIMYQVINNARSIERAVNQMERMEMDDEVDQFLEAGSKYDSSFTNQQVLDAAKAMESSYRQIQRLRKETTQLWEDEDMDPEQKLRELNRIYREKLELSKDAWMERPGAAVQFEALEQTLIDMPPDSRPAYLAEQNLPFTRDLLMTLRRPNDRLRKIYEENSA